MPFQSFTDYLLLEKNYSALTVKAYQADLKALRRNKLGLGVSVGYGFTSQGQNAFFRLSLNYTLIRF